jgi:transcriptional regulator with XRE-family HTH domain
MLITYRVLKRIRKDKGLNQDEMAKLLGMSQANYNKIENKSLAIKPAIELKVKEHFADFLFVNKSNEEINREVSKRLTFQIKQWALNNDYGTVIEMSKHLGITPNQISQIFISNRGVSLSKVYRVAIKIPTMRLEYTILGTGEPFVK